MDEYTTTETPKKNNTVLIVVIVVAVVLICCCCCSFALAWQYGDAIMQELDLTLSSLPLLL
ncbi:MAG: hypothetical protein ACOYYS_23940 [Chloroflexota bacterium]